MDSEQSWSHSHIAPAQCLDHSPEFSCPLSPVAVGVAPKSAVIADAAESVGAVVEVTSPVKGTVDEIMTEKWTARKAVIRIKQVASSQGRCGGRRMDGQRYRKQRKQE